MRSKCVYATVGTCCRIYTLLLLCTAWNGGERTEEGMGYVLYLLNNQSIKCNKILYILIKQNQAKKLQSNQDCSTFTSLDLLVANLPNWTCLGWRVHNLYSQSKMNMVLRPSSLPLDHLHRPTRSPPVLLLVFNCRRSDVESQSLILSQGYLLIPISVSLRVQTVPPM
jgi:hypothetical protein